MLVNNECSSWYIRVVNFVASVWDSEVKAWSAYIGPGPVAKPCQLRNKGLCINFLNEKNRHSTHPPTSAKKLFHKN